MYARGRPKSRFDREVLMRIKDRQTIREARLAAGYTQYDLAALCRCTQATISALETGAMTGCSESLAKDLVKWLKRTERELFTRTPGTRMQRVTNGAGLKRPRQAVAA